MGHRTVLSVRVRADVHRLKQCTDDEVFAIVRLEGRSERFFEEMRRWKRGTKQKKRRSIDRREGGEETKFTSTSWRDAVAISSSIDVRRRTPRTGSINGSQARNLNFRALTAVGKS